MSQRVVGLRNGPGICLLRSCACVCVVCVFLASFSRGVQWNKGGQAAAAAAAHPCYAFGLAFARHELGDGTPALPWWEGPGRLQRLFERALRRDRPGLVLAHGGPIVGAESWVDLEILGLWGLVWWGGLWLWALSRGFWGVRCVVEFPGELHQRAPTGVPPGSHQGPTRVPPSVKSRL